MSTEHSWYEMYRVSVALMRKHLNKNVQITILGEDMIKAMQARKIPRVF